MAVKQQTVALALDAETGGTFEASRLHSMPEVEFTALRRATLAARNARKRGLDAWRFKCVICCQPLYLSRYHTDDGNRWFKHDGKPAQVCPWYEGTKLPPDMHRALIYRGYQEGETHKRLKAFIASWLSNEPKNSDVRTEQVTFGEVLVGERKRPDVKCNRGPDRLVFELQLSYTFLTEVLKREEFYAREGIFIIWVFGSFDVRKSTVRDQAFYGLRNVLVLDEAAMQRTIESGELIFTGYFQRPVVDGTAISDIWDTRPVNLDDVSFPKDTYRAFFHDYDKALVDAKAQLAEEARQRSYEAWASALERYVAAAMKYYENDYAEVLKEDVIAAVDVLYDHEQWHRGFEVLKSTEFFGWHRVLPILLSIKHNRPVGYNKSLTAFRVLEAGLRQTIDGKHGLAVMYLWAYQAYKPSVTPEQKKWIAAKAYEIKGLIEGGDMFYQRAVGFDEAVGALFPELEEKLVTPWGTGSTLQRYVDSRLSNPQGSEN